MCVWCVCVWYHLRGVRVSYLRPAPVALAVCPGMHAVTRQSCKGDFKGRCNVPTATAARHMHTRSLSLSQVSCLLLPVPANNKLVPMRLALTVEFDPGILVVLPRTPHPTSTPAISLALSLSQSLSHSLAHTMKPFITRWNLQSCPEHGKWAWLGREGAVVKDTQTQRFYTPLRCVHRKHSTTHTSADRRYHHALPSARAM